MTGELWAWLGRTDCAMGRWSLGMLWQSSCFMVVVGLLALCLRGRHASVRRNLWLVALLIGPLLPVAGTLGSRLGAPRAAFPILPVHERVTAIERAAENPAVAASIAESAHGADSAVYGTTSPDLADRPMSPWPLFSLSYAVVSMAFLLWIAMGSLRARQWLATGSVVADDRVFAVFRSVAERMGLRRGFRVFETKYVATPMSLGVFRSVILLPRGFAKRMSHADVQAIAVHELAHVARWDAAVLLVVAVARAVLFFHPLVWVAARRIAVLSEEAADESALVHGAAPVAYARMLTRLAEAAPRCMFGVECAAGFALGRSAFVQRVKAILAHAQRPTRALGGRALLAVVFAVGAAFGGAASVSLGERPSVAEKPSERAEKPSRPARPARIELSKSPMAVTLDPDKLVLSDEAETAFAEYLRNKPAGADAFPRVPCDLVITKDSRRLDEPMRILPLDRLRAVLTTILTTPEGVDLADVFDKHLADENREKNFDWQRVLSLTMDNTQRRFFTEVPNPEDRKGFADFVGSVRRARYPEDIAGLLNHKGAEYRDLVANMRQGVPEAAAALVEEINAYSRTRLAQTITLIVAVTSDGEYEILRTHWRERQQSTAKSVDEDAK